MSAATAGLNQLNTQLSGTANAFNQARPAALLFEAGAAAVGASLLTSVKVAADFEHQMAGVRAVLSPTEVGQFGDALSALALTLGRDTTFTSRQAAAAIEELIKAGLPAKDVLDGAAAGALNLAAATGVSTADAATITAQALNTFGLAASNSTLVVDKLAGVANTSASDISFLRFGFASVGGVAAGLGLTFQDTADALGILSKTFAGGSDAGTSLKTFLQRLQPTTKAQSAEFKLLGLTTAQGGNAFFDAAGHVKSLADISGVLRRALGGMTDQQRQAALQTLFGTDAIRAALGLYDAGAAGVRKFAEESGQQGVAAKSAETRLNSLEGALNNLGGSVETVQIIIGQLFLPNLRQLADAARSVVDRFSNLSPEMQRGVVAFLGISAAIAGLLGAIVLLAPFIAALPAAFAAMGSVLAGLVPIFAGVALVAGALFLAWQNDFGGIQGIVATVVDRVSILLQGLGVVFDRVFSGDLAGALDVFRGVVVAAVPELEGFINGAIDLARVIGPILGDAFERVAAFLGAEIVPRLRDLAAGVIPALQAASVALGLFWETRLGPALQAVATFIASEVAPRLQAFADTAIPAVIGASQALQDFWTTQLGPAAETIGNFIAQNVEPAFQTLTAALGGAKDVGVSIFGNVADQISKLASVIGPGIIQFFRDDLPAALSAIGAQAQSLGPFIGSLTSFLGALFNVITAFGEVGATALQGLFINVLVPGFEKLGAALGPVAPVFDGIGQSVTTMANGLGLIGEKLEPVTKFFNDAANALNTFADALRKAPPLPGFLTPPAAAGAGNGGATATNAAFIPGGGFGAAGASVGSLTIQINSGPISGEADEQRLALTIASIFDLATRRAQVPVPAGQPGLVGGFD